MMLSETLQEGEVDSTGYNTHSFRIGAATTAKANGISDVHIKMLGGWQSSTYQLYIRTPQEQLAILSKQLAAKLGHVMYHGQTFMIILFEYQVM